MKTLYASMTAVLVLSSTVVASAESIATVRWKADSEIQPTRFLAALSTPRAPDASKGKTALEPTPVSDPPPIPDPPAVVEGYDFDGAASMPPVEVSPYTESDTSSCGCAAKPAAIVSCCGTPKAMAKSCCEAPSRRLSAIPCSCAPAPVCDAAPESCGCTSSCASEPSCGCSAAPSCGCEPSSYCGGRRHEFPILKRLFSCLHCCKKGHCKKSCGCDDAPSCGCDVAPACGCDVAPACGCDAAPSCASAAPSCGCGA